MKAAFFLLLFWAVPALAEPLPTLAVEDMAEADIVVLGEVHDNPQHHQTQARVISRIGPHAVVFEMLTPKQAALFTRADLGDADKLREKLDWDASGWPDFALYYPLFSAYPSAEVVGAGIPRASARDALKTGIAKTFGPEAERYGLTEPLPAAEAAAREALQAQAHCDALPASLLPDMVAIQRLRDAELARAALDALDVSGAPVVIVTGNGHARRDWGVPAYIARLRPKLKVISVGQAEEGAPLEGTFDYVLTAPPAPREDPCAAFGKTD